MKQPDIMRARIPVSTVAPDGKTLFGIEAYPPPPLGSLTAGNLRDCWKDNAYRVSPEQINETGIVLDIGASFAPFSFFVCSLDPNVKVFAFEPNPESYGCLVKNVVDNNMQDRIFPVNRAICAVREYKYMLSNLTGSNILRQPPDTHQYFNGVFGVDAITLSDIFTEYELDKVDLMKVDIEAGEYEVFRTTPLEVFERIKHIAVELHATYEPIDELKAEMIKRLELTHVLNVVGYSIFAKRKEA